MTGVGNRELTPDTGGSLLHSLQTVVAIFTLFCHRGVDANAVVSDDHRKIVSVFQFNFQSTTLRVRTGIPNRFVADAVNFITDYWMHLFRVPRYRKGDLHGTLHSALFCCSPEGFG